MRLGENAWMYNYYVLYLGGCLPHQQLVNFTDVVWQHFTLGGGQKAVSIFYQWPSMRALSTP